jgi:hypothetical protein
MQLQISFFVLSFFVEAGMMDAYFKLMSSTYQANITKSQELNSRFQGQECNYRKGNFLTTASSSIFL